MYPKQLLASEKTCLSLHSRVIFVRENFAEKRSLTRHVKEQHGLVIVATNRSIDVIIMKCISESVCLKLLGNGGVVNILVWWLQRGSKIM